MRVFVIIRILGDLMTTKLDYLKKYLSKSDVKQLQSQTGRGEKIKIKDTTKLRKKRRKTSSQPSGFIIGDVEEEKREESSDWSDGEGPTVVEFIDESRGRLSMMWNPISRDDNSNDNSGAASNRVRHDSSSDEDALDVGPVTTRRRHDSDNDVDLKRTDTPHSDTDIDVTRRVRHDLTHSSHQQESDSDIEVRRKSRDVERGDRRREAKRGTRWSREERGGSVRSEGTACAVVVSSKQQDNNQTVYRDKHGHKIDTEREAAMRAEEERTKLDRDAKFKIMKSGVAQARMREERAANFAEESGKGLARYKGDDSLNAQLRAKELMEDPLTEMKRKKSKRKEPNERCKPTYQGNFPSNRFDIRPGYRWDGVDRSNGYEKERFQIVNSRKADHDEYYKWSTEDL